MSYILLSNENIVYINLGICVFSAIISLMSVWITGSFRKVHHLGSAHIMGMSMTNTFLSLAYFLELICDGRPGTGIHLGMYLADCLQYFLPYLGAMQMTYYIAECIEDASGSLHFRKYIQMLYAGVFLLAIFGTVSGTYFYIDKQNTYNRGSLFWLSQLLGFLLIALNVYLINGKGREMSYNLRKIQMMYLVFPTIALILQNILMGIYLFVAATSITVLMMAILLQSDQLRYFYENEQELGDARLALVLTQMRPHFLYNALSSISQLCKKDPMEASRMTDLFAEFLRKNMNDMKNNEPIPITREIGHIKNYVSIEQMRFGEDLTVEYDLQDTEFSVPALVIQPLVENAIHHGICSREEGGTIRIATRKSAGSHMITITDDGVGFDIRTVRNDGKVHLGISSVRERLRKTIGSDMMISSTPGKGTSVTIIIPKESKD